MKYKPLQTAAGTVLEFLLQPTKQEYTFFIEIASLLDILVCRFYLRRRVSQHGDGITMYPPNREGSNPVSFSLLVIRVQPSYELYAPATAAQVSRASSAWISSLCGLVHKATSEVETHVSCHCTATPDPIPYHANLYGPCIPRWAH